MCLPGLSERPIPRLLCLAPSRPAIAFQEALREAAPLVAFEVPASHGPQPWSFRDPGHNLVWRFFAHLLIRLLVLTPLPPNLQVASVLFPVSMLWPLVRPAEPAQPAEGGSEKVGEGILFAAAVCPLSESLGVAFSGGADPTRQQTLDSIAGHLQLDENGILYGSAARSFGMPDPLGGLRTAVLGKVTIITAAQDNPVILDLDRKSIETQTIKYKVIPPNEEIQDSELVIVQATGQGETVYRRLPAPLEEGKGQLTLPEGVAYPLNKTVKARLVVNRDDPQAPRPLAKVLLGEAFKVLPRSTSSLAIDDDPLDVAGVSQAIIERVDRGDDPPYESPNLGWSATGPSGYGVVPANESPESGFYLTEFKPGVFAGTQHEVDLRMGGVLLGRTAPITVSPGRAAVAALRAEGPPQSPTTPGVIPADGATVVNVLLEEIRDVAGNLVEDGTPVMWSVEGDAGEILDQETVTSGGRSATRYRAGIEPGQVTVWAKVGDKEWLTFIQQEFLRITVTQEAFTPPYENLKAEVTWGGGFPVSDDAVVEWTSSYGVTGWWPLQGGVSMARWSPTISTPLALGRMPTTTLIVGVGRSRGGKVILIRTRPDQMRLFLEQQMLIGDVPPTPAQAGASGGDQDPGRTQTAGLTATQTTLRVEGGPPGETVRLTLGSTHSPVVQAVAEWPVDDLAGQVTEDVYGGPAADVGPGVTLDQETVVQGGSLRFSGVGGLIVQGATYLGLQSNLGLSGYVRFDSVEAGQKILEKAGSYALTVVEDSDQPHLEFSVTSGGEQRRVLSPQALAVGTWYHFSAQWIAGRLRLGVGSGSEIGISEPVGQIDLSASPLVFGPTLVGNLDRLQVYDLSRPALALFPGNLTEIELALDAEGSGQTTITATGMWQAPSALVFAAASGSSNASADAIPSGQSIPIQHHVALDPPQVESYGNHLRVHTEASLRQCGEGLASGENNEWSGIGCDIALSLVIPLEIPVAVRDLVVSGKNLIKGKATVGAYVIGAFALVTLIPKRLPVVGPVLRRLSRAADALNVPWVKKKLADKALDAAVEAAEGVIRTADERLIKIAAGEAGDEAKEALADVARALDDKTGPAAWDTLERLGKACEAASVVAARAPKASEVPSAAATSGACWNLPALVIGIRKINRTFGPEILGDVAKILGKVDFPAALSSEALEGIAAFCKRIRATSNVGTVGRVRRIVKEIELSGISSQRQAQAIENLFGWIKKADGANINGLDNFLRSGPGTSVTKHSTQGAYHTLERLVVDHKLQNIYCIECSIPRTRSGRRMDIVLNGPQPGTYIGEELKNLSPGQLLHDGALTQVLRDAEGVIDIVKARTGRVLRPGPLGEELANRRYIFRLTEALSGPARRDIEDALRLGLPARFKYLAKKADVIFQGRVSTSPF